MGTTPGEEIDTTRWPTSTQINVLPKPIRDYIHDLNAGYDPRGDVRRQVIELHCARETIDALSRENLRLRAIIGRLLRRYKQ